MRTNIEIDDKLMKQAMKASGLETKKAVVQEALTLFVRIRSQSELLKYFGKFKSLEGYDPEAAEKDKWAEADKRWAEEQRTKRIRSSGKRKAA